MLFLELSDSKSCNIADDLKQFHFALLFPLSGQSTGSNVVEVLQPFEIAHCDTSYIAQDVWEEDNSFLQTDLFSSKGCGSVSSLSNDFALELVSVCFVNCLFEGGGDENVTLFVDSSLIFKLLFSFGVILNSTLFLFVFQKVIRVNSVGVVN